MKLLAGAVFFLRVVLFFGQREVTCVFIPGPNPHGTLSAILLTFPIFLQNSGILFVIFPNY